MFDVRMTVSINFAILDEYDIDTHLSGIDASELTE